MFWIIYGFNLIILLYASSQNNVALAFTSIFLYVIINAWHQDHTELTKLKNTLGNIPDQHTLHIEAQNLATDPKNNYSWYQKLIFIKAFIAGAEYIKKKFKQ